MVDTNILIDNKISDRIPLVSVCIQTYQHVSFIAKCLDSILEQKTTFPFEIIVGEDGSDDGTREICERYAKLYPEAIRLFVRSRNDVIYIDGRPTGRFNFLENIKASKGVYIALCEGDDYWTDDKKLQKQIDFLESHPDFGICFNKVLEKNSFDESKNRYIPAINSDTVYTTADYILSNQTATCSMVFRKNLLYPVPEWFYEVPFGDLAISLLAMSRTNNKAFVFNDIMGVYNIHAGGIHGSFHKSPKMLTRAFKQHLKFNQLITDNLFKNNEYSIFIYRKFAETYHQLENLNRINRNIPGLLYNKAMKLYYRFKSKSAAA